MPGGYLSHKLRCPTWFTSRSWHPPRAFPVTANLPLTARCSWRAMLHKGKPSSNTCNPCDGAMSARPAPAPWHKVCFFIVMRGASVASETASPMATRIRLVEGASDGCRPKLRRWPCRGSAHAVLAPCGSGLWLWTLSSRMRALPLRMRDAPDVASYPVWSKNSCSLTLVVFQEASESFMALNGSLTLAA